MAKDTQIEQICKPLAMLTGWPGLASQNHCTDICNWHGSLSNMTLLQRHRKAQWSVKLTWHGQRHTDRTALQALITDALPFVNRETKLGAFTVNGDLAVSVEDEERNIQWDSVLPINTQSGKNITIGLNLAYLEKILKCLSTDEVLWQYGSPISAGILTGVNSKSPNDINLIMPIRLKESEETDG